MKKFLKNSIIVTLVLYFTLTALTDNEYALTSLFVISAVLVLIGFKRLKPLVITGSVLLLALIIFGDLNHTVFQVVGAIIRLAGAVTISTLAFLYFTKSNLKSVKSLKALFK